MRVAGNSFSCFNYGLMVVMLCCKCRVLVDKQTEPAVVVNCTAKDLSVDWIHNHLYWTEDSRVHMSSMCGKLQTVVAEDPNKPFSIVVDPINRWAMMRS